jgi:hypothetical protein
MIHPPRTVESLLEALGAEAEFRDDLLGDMAEEFSLRAAYDGIAAARRWYWCEAARTTPHLLRNWLRGLRAPDVARLGGVVLTSYVLVGMLTFFVLITARSVMVGIGIAPSREVLSQDATVMLVVGTIVGVWSALASGYVSAWLNERAPLASALSLGAIWSVAGLALTASRGPLGWNGVLAPVVLVLGTTAGGILRVSASLRSRRTIQR